MLICISSKTNRGALQTGCRFPQSYTELHNERWNGEGGALQTGDVPISVRIEYANIPLPYGDIFHFSSQKYKIARVSTNSAIPRVQHEKNTALSSI